MIIAVDFDGTLVTHEYPNVGMEVPLAFRYLQAFQKLGATLILLTMRSGDKLTEAVNYCAERNVVFDHVNENPQQKEWTSSPKIYAHLYIDDAAFGAPLRTPNPVIMGNNREVIDWTVVGPEVMKMLVAQLGKKT